MTSGFKNWTCDPEWHELEAEPLIELPGKWDSANWYNSVIPRPKAMRYKVGDEVTCIDIPQWGNCRIEHIKIHKDGKQGCFIRQITGGDNAIWCFGEHLEPARRTSSEKDIPPEWCKVGAWVWSAALRSEFARITGPGTNAVNMAAITCEGFECLVLVDEQAVSCEATKPARVRPWTFEEAPESVKTAENSEYLECCWHLNGIFKGEPSFFCWKDNFISASKMAETMTQLDGSPCGVLEIVEVSE